MKRVIILSLAVALFVGCYKTELNSGTNPDVGVVVVNANIPASASDDSYTVVIDGEEIAVGADGSVRLPETFSPGEYTAYLYNEPDNTTIESKDSDVIASVDIASDGVVSGDAGILYFGKQTFNISTDGVTTAEIEMVQVTRELNFSLQLDGDAIDRITKVSALLEGVSQQWDCVNDRPLGESYSVVPTLTKSTVQPKQSVTRADGVSILTGTIYLLGIDPTKEQKLTITLEYKDSYPVRSEVVVSNISTQLKDFNSNKSTPLLLSGSVETPTSTSSDGNTVIDWNAANNGEVTVK